jgi:hypothetical protein
LRVCSVLILHISLNTLLRSTSSILLAFLFYRGGNWGSEQLSDFCRFSWIVSSDHSGESRWVLTQASLCVWSWGPKV